MTKRPIGIRQLENRIHVLQVRMTNLENELERKSAAAIKNASVPNLELAEILTVWFAEQALEPKGVFCDSAIRLVRFFRDSSLLVIKTTKAEGDDNG